MAKKDKTIFSGFEGNADNPLDLISQSTPSFFSGADPVAFSGIPLDPFTTGYAFIYWVHLPEWFEKDDDLKNFKSYTQKFMKAFNGITDIELQESAQQYGFAGNESSFVTGINKGNTDFTMSFYEYSGSPTTKLFTKWITMIRDPNTGIPLYPNAYDTSYEYSAKNHTGQLLYIVMRPDVTSSKNNIEKAFLYANVLPINIPNSTLYNFELGSTDSPSSVDINFKGVQLTGAAVDAYARKVLDENILKVGVDNPNGRLFLDTLTRNGDVGTDVLNTGILKDIYNSNSEE